MGPTGTGTLAGPLLCYTVDGCSYPRPALTTQQAWRFLAAESSDSHTHGHLLPLISMLFAAIKS